MIKENLFIGVGVRNQEKNYLKFMSLLFAGINPLYSHSNLLQMLAEFGPLWPPFSSSILQQRLALEALKSSILIWTNRPFLDSTQDFLL